MSNDGEYLNHLTIYHYAKEAFCFDPDKPSGYDQGGIYAGSGTEFEAPGDKAMPARARLVKIAPGKVLVRWCGSWVLGAGWEKAAAGAWWSSDSGADHIVESTADKLGRYGDSGILAREYSNVGYTWTGQPGDRGAAGTYKSDMGAVVAVETTKPITLMIGAGRPVQNPTLMKDGSIKNVTMIGDELQLVMLTVWKGRFRGNEFLRNIFFGTSTQFTDWWLRAYIVNRRRMKKIIDARQTRGR